jgi:predicted CoA-binding protein
MSSTKNETVLVLGATPNPERYSYKATVSLAQAGHIPVPYGIRKGEIAGFTITSELPESGIDTVTMYVGPQRQAEYYDYLIKLKPNRIIFNPGTENPELFELAQANGIEVEVACTLVLLATDQY